MSQDSVSMEPVEKSSEGCIEQNLPDTDSDYDGIPSSPDKGAFPKPEKRPTRQWAAWTREEEECFFTALRQVGKNFQKITCRVQSKNKDQVRHYYYRLVRRMNKLLGPGLCLDAKNSKDTNGAMLRWWSLLEKYSCKASKLHLKPRRFKIFVEALEHQLLKDRKKYVKKQSSQGDNCSSPTSTCPSQNKSSGNDLRAVKGAALDGQNVEKVGNGKGSATRRSLNLGVTRSSNKGELSAIKSTRQRRKTGVLSTAAIKRWEKAAMAGVSLVADAAEHVERTSGGSQANFLDGLTVLSAQAVDCSIEQNDPGLSDQIQANPLTKLKLQLFPIDDNTRKALEMDNHNPHLELTLSTRKKISSVLEHMGRKWGSCSVASGELMLFPYSITRENLFAYKRWTRDSVAIASEVYDMIGSPPIFRLRYGWIIPSELQSAPLPPHVLMDDITAEEAPLERTTVPVEKDEMGKHVSYTSGVHPTVENSTSATCSKANGINIENNLSEPANLHSITTGSGFDSHKVNKVVVHKLKKTPSFSPGDWADSLTNVSTEDLLPEVPHKASTSCVEEIPFTCDSFDAAIAAHIRSHHKSSYSRPSPHLSSIWDAEETCDEFTFRKRAVARKQAIADSADTDVDQELAGEAMDEDVKEDQVECLSEPRELGNPSKDFTSLTDIYWPESLGPLELDVPSCKYYSEDLILSDSGLNRLIASSLDAFQHCSLFGLDDKGPSPPPGGSQRGASFAGKIGTGDTAGIQPLHV